MIAALTQGGHVTPALPTLVSTMAAAAPPNRTTEPTTIPTGREGSMPVVAQEVCNTLDSGTTLSDCEDKCFRSKCANTGTAAQRVGN